MNKTRIPGILLGVGIFFTLVWWIVTPTNDADPVADTPTFTTVQNDELGVSFAYRSNPNPYRLSETARGDDELRLFRYRYTLQLQADYEEAQATSETPREGPPMITVTVFANPDEVDAAAWSEAMEPYVETDLMMSEPEAVAVGDIDGSQYTADGLYASRVVWVSNGEFMYRFQGEWVDDTTNLRSDFQTLLDSVEFTSG